MWENEPRHQSYQVSGGPPSSSESKAMNTSVRCGRQPSACISLTALAMANMEPTPAPSSAADVIQWSKWQAR